MGERYDGHMDVGGGYSHGYGSFAVWACFKRKRNLAISFAVELVPDRVACDTTMTTNNGETGVLFF